MAAGEEPAASVKLQSFLSSGVYHLGQEGSNFTFVDPVRVLNESYSRFKVSASSYYSRSFQPSTTTPSSNSRKRRREKRKTHELNEREKTAEKRHQEIRPLLLRAHEALLQASDLLKALPKFIRDEEAPSEAKVGNSETNFLEIGSLWQAPLYEISLSSTHNGECSEETSLQLFNSFVCNYSDDDLEAIILHNLYILPKRSCFHMSDLRQIQSLLPACSDHGFNLIVIDPPWENGSAKQKMIYPTLPNRYFLNLPVDRLVHTEGALVALWVTNREKLRAFVEKDLLPAWGVTNITCYYWLKVKADGSLIGELDLFHHRPYECLYVGYVNKKVDSVRTGPSKSLQTGQVFVSIPGSYSRKPPIGKLLLNCTPGPKPPRCIELFSRDLLAGWTSWGNECLRFQDSSYFARKGKDGAQEAVAAELALWREPLMSVP